MVENRAFQFVELAKADAGVAVLTLNRSSVLNALTLPMVSELHQALNIAAKDTEVGCLLLTGRGRGFCSGADLGSSANKPTEAGGARSLGDGVADDMLNLWNPMMNALHEFPKPTVCALNGVCAGGGVGLALAGDVVIAARSARFVLTFAPILGIAPDLGATWSVARSLGRGKALPLALLGDSLPAADAERMGMVWQVVDDASLLPSALSIARRLASHTAAALVETRNLIDHATKATFQEQVELERRAQRWLFDRPDAPFKKGRARFEESAIRRAKL
jgi:2-(1,2-epoxy-1,2-dihydrophenyl)acetyl-CoA isomerase